MAKKDRCTYIDAVGRRCLGPSDGLSIELDGSVHIVNRENGKEVERTPLDPEVAIQAILRIVEEAVRAKTQEMVAEDLDKVLKSFADSGPGPG